MFFRIHCHEGKNKPSQVGTPDFIHDQSALFGSYLRKWIDEFAYITAALDYPGNRFVTGSLDNVVSKEPIQCGGILCFSINGEKLGNTSVHYSVVAVNAKDTEDHCKILLQTGSTFVKVSPSGGKEPIRR